MAHSLCPPAIFILFLSFIPLSWSGREDLCPTRGLYSVMFVCPSLPSFPQLRTRVRTTLCVVYAFIHFFPDPSHQPASSTYHRHVVFLCSFHALSQKLQRAREKKTWLWAQLLVTTNSLSQRQFSRACTRWKPLKRTLLYIGTTDHSYFSAAR